VTTRQKQLLWIVCILLGVVLLDQVTKQIVVHVLPEGGQYPGGYEDRFFRFTFEKNPGLVGGMFREQPLIARTAPLLASLVLLFLYGQLHISSRLQATAYGMVAGGAIGNMIDRFRLGWVIDFLEFHFYFVPFDFPWKRYPAFNVADSAICVGVALLIFGWHLAERRRLSSQKERNAADAV
jgi:signal peptidase II